MVTKRGGDRADDDDDDDDGRSGAFSKILSESPVSDLYFSSNGPLVIIDDHDSRK